MNNLNLSGLEPSAASLLYGYMAACAALGLDPPSMALAELVRTTKSAKEMIDAVHAMRNAREHDRVLAALAMLRKLRSEEGCANDKEKVT